MGKESFIPEQNNIIDNKGLRRNALDEYNVKIKLRRTKRPCQSKTDLKGPSWGHRLVDLSFSAG